MKKRFCLKISSKYKIGIVWAFRSNLLVLRLLDHATNLTFSFGMKKITFWPTKSLREAIIHYHKINLMLILLMIAMLSASLKLFLPQGKSSLKLKLSVSWMFPQDSFFNNFFKLTLPLKCWMFLEALSTLSKYCRPFVNAAQLILNLYIVYNQSANL